MPETPLSLREAQLIKRICDGDPEPFRELVRPYERLVYVTAISILRNEADAAEVAQEAVLKAFSKLASFRGESKFSTWLVQITYNEARMRVKKDRRYLYESLDQQGDGAEGDHWPRDFADWRPIPSEALEDDQTRQALRSAIDSLSPKYREVLVLRDVDDLSTNEVATVLGISEGTVKTRLHRARLALRDVLAPGIDGSWIVGRHYQKVRPW